MKDPFCDENGVCTPANLEDLGAAPALRQDVQIIYVGDPMCSWCWGISNHLSEIQDHYREKGIGYEIIVGGLRPGGGDEWDHNMKRFLRHHWKEVTARSGQPFGYEIFDRHEFNYDTEPACRAVVVAKQYLDAKGVSKFFEDVQRKFYVDNEDPTTPKFYDSICQQFEIPFSDFLTSFDSEEGRKATRDEFMLNRKWGVRGYPTVVLQVDDQLYLVANGYATATDMKERIDQLLVETSKEMSAS